MSRLLAILFLVLCPFCSKAQCVYKWTDGNSPDSLFVEKTSTGQIPVFNRVFSVKFIDSLIDDIKVNPNPNPTYRDFKLFKTGGVEIAHYKTQGRYLVGKDTIIVHYFSYDVGDWNEDGNYMFFYAKEFGVIYKCIWGMVVGYTDVYWLRDNSCMSDLDRTRLKLLIPQVQDGWIK